MNRYASALRSLAEAAAARAGAELKLELALPPEKLAPAVEQCLFRVAQEALENAVRHSEARHLDVRLAHESGRLVLVVADDGQGFDTGQMSEEGRFGLRGMRERAEMVGGRLEICSRPGRGTTIRLILEPER